MNTALLDRDGVIVRNRAGYVREPDDLELLPGSAEAIGRLCRAGWRVIVVTNQSVVGRGIISEATLARIHERLTELVRSADGGIERVFACTHHPLAGCECRKPRPGLLLAAHDQAGVTLGDAVLIGDMPSDAQAARAAGCRAILVGGEHVAGVTTVADLGAAADLLLGALVAC